MHIYIVKLENIPSISVYNLVYLRFRSSNRYANQSASNSEVSQVSVIPGKLFIQSANL